MATIPARRANAPTQARTFMVLCVLMVVLLPAVWVAVSICVLRTRAVQEMGAASAAARMNFDELLDRILKTMAAFNAADARSTDRIALAAHMLRLEARLAPAGSLFLYDASGRFVAATVPLLPGEDVVGRTAWFRSAEAGFQAGGLMLFGPTREPLGQGQGFVITRSLIGSAGTFAGVVGTFLGLSSIRPLLRSAHLPPGSTVELRAAEGGAAVLRFSIPGATLDGAFEPELAGVGWVPAVSATVALPGGFEWHATASPFSELTAAEGRAIRWGATLLAGGPLLLLVAFGLKRRGRRSSQGKSGDPSPAARRPEPDWMWEINAEGFLVGIAGNAPRPLIEAVGKKLCDLVADDPRSRDLRDAIARRASLRDVTVGVVVAEDTAGAPRRFSLTGFPVQATGGFWGTAREVCATTESGIGLLGTQLADAVVPVQASAVSANSPSMRPSSVLPGRHASALRCAASM